MNSEKQHYERAEIWEPSYRLSEFNRNRFELIQGMIPDEVGSMLDAGCGDGIYLDKLAKPGRWMLGVERSRTAIAIAIRSQRCALVNGDINALPFRDGSVDLVTVLEVLEHLPFQCYDRAREEIVRVTRRDIIVNVPFREKRLFINCPDCGCSFNPTCHLRTFDSREMSALFPGFDLVEQRFLRSPEINCNNFLWFQRLYNAVFNPGFPGHLPVTDAWICPACGYQPVVTAGLNPDGLNGTDWKYQKGRSHLKRFIINLWARLPQPRYTEVIARYRRRALPSPHSSR